MLVHASRVACALVLLSTPLRAALPEVLILLSRNPADTWATAELDGMQKGLGEARPPVPAVVEWMDWQGGSGQPYEQFLIAYYTKKFAQHRFRVVLAADEPALTFLLAHRGTLFPQAQVVFGGVPKVDGNIRADRPWLTGVLENTDPAATFRLAITLQPRLQRLYILEDSTTPGLGVKQRLERDLPEETRRVPLALLRADTTQELFNAVEALPPDTAVLLTRSRVARRVLTELRAHCPVPIYGQRSPTHSGGLLAGALIDGERHGEAVARLGRKLLAGASAADLPLVTDVPPRVVADYAEMKRFGFSFHALPAGTEILNSPRRPWHDYPHLVATTGMALICLAFLVVLLASALRQRRRAADALKNSLSLLHATFNATADGLLAVDGSGKVTEYNCQLLALWRIPPEIAARGDGDALLRFFSEQVQAPDLFLQRVHQLHATPEAESMDVIELKDGRTLERRSRPQILDRRIVGQVWNFTDITERRTAERKHRKLEAELAHAQKLEALGTLAGGIAHDFNNLLTAILGYTQLAQDGLPEEHPARADLAVALSAGERARDLVQQILTFSRKGPAQHRHVTLDGVVKDAVRLLRATLSTTIELRSEIHDAARTVLADASQVHQAILNLAGNAVQALGHQAGQIVVRLEPVEVTAATAREQPQLRAGRYLCLSVTDTGPGIPPEILPRIFDPFFTSKQPGDGTGLGLAVVHGIMRSHEGAVTVESTPGKATNFRLYFPEVAAPANGHTPPPTRTELGRHERILAIDDDSKVLHITERLLQTLGYDVTACRGPEGALELLRTEAARFDAVVTDLNMPQLSGLDLTAELRKFRPDLPVVLVTGFVGAGEVEARARELGIAAIVEKPFTSVTLGAAVRTALDQAQMARVQTPAAA